MKREDLEKFLRKSEPRMPSITHYEWEENGEKFSSWKIDTGSSIMYTGDAGAELFQQQIKNWIYGRENNNH